MPYPTVKQFSERVRIGDGCWEWVGARLPRGYGTFSYRDEGGRVRSIRAHRWAYELLVGAIPDGLQLDHLCMNTWCVRPSHLDPVTGAENMRRWSESLPVPADLPAPSRVGVAVAGWGEGRTHGYESTYCDGCRCALCTAAHRLNSRRRRQAKAAEEIEAEAVA